MLDANYVQQAILSAANKYGVPPQLALAIGHNESSFNPNVSDSSAGAIGPMQLMPATAQGLGVDPRNVDQNIDGGVRYLKQQLDAFHGDPIMASAAYNAGPGRVQSYLTGGASLPAETQNYIQKVSMRLGGQTPMPQVMQQPSQSYPQPSIMAQLKAGGPGALIGAPNGVFPDAQGRQGGGYDLGRNLQRSGAWLESIANPSGGASLLNATNMPLFRQNYGTVSDALGNMYLVNHKSGQVIPFSNILPKSAGVGGSAGATDIPTALAQSPLARKAEAEASAKNDQDKLQKLEEAATQARVDNDMISNQLIPILQNPNVSQGALAEYKTDAKNVLKSMTGIDMGGVAEGQRLGELSSRLASNNAKQMGVQRYAGPEIAMAKGSTINENQPRETNLQAAQDYLGINKRTIAMHDLAQQFHAAGLPLSGAKWNAALKEIAKAYPTWVVDPTLMKTGAESGASGLPKGVKSIQVLPAQ